MLREGEGEGEGVRERGGREGGREGGGGGGCCQLLNTFPSLDPCSRWVFNLIHGTTIGLLVEVLACK